MSLADQVDELERALREAEGEASDWQDKYYDSISERDEALDEADQWRGLCEAILENLNGDLLELLRKHKVSKELWT